VAGNYIIMNIRGISYAIMSIMMCGYNQYIVVAHENVIKTSNAHAAQCLCTECFSALSCGMVRTLGGLFLRSPLGVLSGTKNAPRLPLFEIIFEYCDGEITPWLDMPSITSVSSFYGYTQFSQGYDSSVLKARARLYIQKKLAFPLFVKFTCNDLDRLNQFIQADFSSQASVRAVDMQAAREAREKELKCEVTSECKHFKVLAYKTENDLDMTHFQRQHRLCVASEVLQWMQSYIQTQRMESST